ncbi:MAG: hypothetical protein ACO38P_09485, partial [Phycisphaerales bacterium]
PPRLEPSAAERARADGDRLGCAPRQRVVSLAESACELGAARPSPLHDPPPVRTRGWIRKLRIQSGAAVRLRVRPFLEQVDAIKLMASVMGQGGTSAAPTFDPSLRTVGGNDIRITNKIDPLQISTNDLPGMRETDSYLTEGRGTFPRSAGVRVNRSLQVKGILEPEGTRVLRLNISRGKSPVNIWDSKAREEAGAGASLMLVDEQGRTFSPIGYFWERRNDSEIDIVIDPVRGIPTVGDFPSLSSSGVDDLYALYRVSLGSKIKAIRLGEIQIANVDLEVK